MKAHIIDLGDGITLRLRDVSPFDMDIQIQDNGPWKKINELEDYPLNLVSKVLEERDQLLKNFAEALKNGDTGEKTLQLFEKRLVDELEERKTNKHKKEVKIEKIEKVQKVENVKSKDIINIGHENKSKNVTTLYNKGSNLPITSVLDKLEKQLKDASNDLKSFSKLAPSEMKEKVTKEVTDAVRSVTKQVEKDLKSLENNANNLSEEVTKRINGIIKNVQGMHQELSKLPGKIDNKIRNDIKAMEKNFNKLLEELPSKITGKVAKIVGDVSKVVGDLKNEVQKVEKQWNDFSKKPVKEQTVEVVNGMGKVIGNVTQKAMDTLKPIQKMVNQLAKDTVEQVKGIIKTLKTINEGFIDLVSKKLPEKIKNDVKDICNQVSKGWMAFKNFASDLVKGFQEGFEKGAGLSVKKR